MSTTEFLNIEKFTLAINDGVVLESREPFVLLVYYYHEPYHRSSDREQPDEPEYISLEKATVIDGTYLTDGIHFMMSVVSTANFLDLLTQKQYEKLEDAILLNQGTVSLEDI